MLTGIKAHHLSQKSSKKRLFQRLILALRSITATPHSEFGHGTPNSLVGLAAAPQTDDCTKANLPFRGASRNRLSSTIVQKSNHDCRPSNAPESL